MMSLAWTLIWAMPQHFLPYCMCAQSRLRSACASAQSDPSLRMALRGWPRIQSIFRRTTKTDQLICVFTRRIVNIVGHAVPRLMLNIEYFAISQNSKRLSTKPVRRLSWMRVRLVARRLRARSPAGSAIFFRGDWSWNTSNSHSVPSADSRKAVVSFLRKNAHNTRLPLGGLSLPSKSVVK